MPAREPPLWVNIRATAGEPRKHVSAVAREPGEGRSGNYSQQVFLSALFVRKRELCLVCSSMTSFVCEKTHAQLPGRTHDMRNEFAETFLLVLERASKLNKSAK